MTSSASPADNAGIGVALPTLADDEAQLAELAKSLSSAARAAIGPWVRAAVLARLPAGSSIDGQTGSANSESIASIGQAQETGSAEKAATDDVGGRLAQLLQLDIDRQRTNPLSILRTAVTYPTEVLQARGVAPVGRDADAIRLHPHDPYDLTPGAFADFGPEVHEAGMRWGAGKAHVHLRRRRIDGQR